jgi:hypothetical protein
VGTGIPSLVNRAVSQEAGSGSDRTRSTLEAAPSPNPTATRRQDAANEHQRAEARKGKAVRMAAFSVKQLPPMSISGRRPAEEKPSGWRRFP